MRIVAAVLAVTALLGTGCGVDMENGSEGTETQAPTVQDGAGEGTVRQMNCQYKVIWPTIGVYEQPTRSSTLLKTKSAGDIVGGYCDWTYHNTSEGNTYLAVTTAAAADDIGWMRREGLTKL